MSVQSSIVSTLVGVKVYPLTVPTDGTFPCATYQKISTIQNRSHSGNSLSKQRYQLSIYAKTYSACLTLANTVRGFLDLNQSQFELVTLENEFDVVEPETGLYSTKIDFYFWS